MQFRVASGLALTAVLTACVASTPPPNAPADPAPRDEAAPDWAARAHSRLPILEPCTRPNVEETLLCGELEVPEDRAKPAGRRLRLEVVVVPAQNVAPPSDAVFVFEGGPGGAVTQRAAGAVWSGPVRQRDIVLMNQRGTSGSNRLDCDLETRGDSTPGRLAEMYPPAAVAACAERLGATADLSRYTSIDHADDVEAARRWLGYEAFNLRGGSYGTRAMMVYALRYPQRARTLFGIGVDSPLRSNLAERGEQAQRALEGLSALCATRPGCVALTPRLDRQLAELLARFDDGPRRFEIEDPGEAGRRLTLEVDGRWLSEQLRLNLYFAFTTQALPFAVHRALRLDDWQPVLQLAVLVERMFTSSLASGLALTVQCSEGMDFDHAAARAAGATTLFGNYRLEQQIQGCAAWPHVPVPPLGLTDPPSHPAPTVWLSGAFDPVTPPTYADDAARLFPNSRHLVLAEGQHGPFDLENGWPCVHRIWGQLLDQGSVAELDTTCAQDMRRPPFITGVADFRAHVAEVLAPMAG